jgi:hypothetical protein
MSVVVEGTSVVTMLGDILAVVGTVVDVTGLLDVDWLLETRTVVWLLLVVTDSLVERPGEGLFVVSLNTV